MVMHKKEAAGILVISFLLGSLAIALLSSAGTERVYAAGNGTQHFGPFSSTSADGGTCGQPWAQDTFNRYFTVHDNGDGTFGVSEDFKDGTFITSGPVSPGACETTNHHGKTVIAGITGNFRGALAGTVTGGTYSPNGCNTNPTACTTTRGFIQTTFGPSANLNTTSFNFEYDSSDQSLQYHHWQDKSSSDGTGEQFIGDIATQ